VFCHRNCRILGIDLNAPLWFAPRLQEKENTRSHLQRDIFDRTPKHWVKAGFRQLEWRGKKARRFRTGRGSGSKRSSKTQGREEMGESMFLDFSDDGCLQVMSQGGGSVICTGRVGRELKLSRAKVIVGGCVIETFFRTPQQCEICEHAAFSRRTANGGKASLLLLLY
jgi:hypothetical protein